MKPTFRDGLRAGLFTMEDLRELPLIGACIARVDARWPGLAAPRREHESLRRFFGLLVDDVLAASKARIAATKAFSSVSMAAAARSIMPLKTWKPPIEPQNSAGTRVPGRPACRTMIRGAAYLAP